MPFKSDKQRRYCWYLYNQAKRQNKKSNWDCKEWARASQRAGSEKLKSKCCRKCGKKSLHHRNVRKQIKKIDRGTFYLFSYGSNNIERLSKTLEVNEDIVWNNSVPAKLENSSRVFFTFAETKQGSVASIRRNPKKTVYGLALKMRKINGNYLNKKLNKRKIK